MAKSLNTAVLDEALNYVKNNATKLVLCSGEPATYNAATTNFGSGGNRLGDVALAAADMTLSDGAGAGRKATVAEKIITVDVAATDPDKADHLAVVDDTGSALLLVNIPDIPREVLAGDNIEVATFDLELSEVT